MEEVQGEDRLLICAPHSNLCTCCTNHKITITGSHCKYSKDRLIPTQNIQTVRLIRTIFLNVFVRIKQSLMYFFNLFEILYTH